MVVWDGGGGGGGAGYFAFVCGCVGHHGVVGRCVEHTVFFVGCLTGIKDKGVDFCSLKSQSSK